MKKIYFLLVAMMVSIAAGAVDYYLIGGNLGWGLKNSKGLFTNNGDGTYTLKLNENLETSSQGFKINDGTWDDASADYNFGGSETLVPGTLYHLDQGKSSGNIKTNPETIKNPTFVLNPSAKTLLVTAEEGEVIESTKYYAIHGSIIKDGWASKLLEDNDGDGVYEYTGTLLKGEFGIKILSSTANYETNDDQVGWIGGGANVTEANKVYSMTGSANSKSTLAGEYTIKFNPTTKEISFNGDNGDTPVVPPTPADKVTIAGNYNLAYSGDKENVYYWGGTKPSWPGVKMATAVGSDGKTYKVFNLPEGTTNVIFNTNGDENKTGDIEYVAGYIFDDNGATSTPVEFTEGGDEPVVNPTDPYTYCLHGQIANGEWGDIALTNNNGIWENTLTLVAGEFGIKKTLNGEQAAWLSAKDNTDINAAGTYNVMADGHNFVSTLEGNYKVSFDPTAMTITFAEVTGPITETVTYAIKGDIFGDPNWSAKVMTEEDGKWVLKANVVAGEFGIQKLVNGAQTEWYQAEGEEVVTVGNGIYPCTGFGGSHFAFVADANNVTFTFDPETKTLSVSDEFSGVEVIEAENAAAEYYNLQGVRVAEPTNGLYIVRRGNTVTKELVK